MRLATILDTEANEPRAVFELPGGERIALRELFRPETETEDDFFEPPLYFSDMAKTAEFLPDVVEAVRQWSRERADRSDESTPVRTSARPGPFLPPVPQPRTYREFDAFEKHATARRATAHLSLSPLWRQAPIFRFSNTGTLVGHETAVVAPLNGNELDFGLQLGVIIGRGGKNIAARDAWRHVAGFTVVNRFVARDLERQEVEIGFGAAKSSDFATAVGPYLVSIDSLRDRIDIDGKIHLTMAARVNYDEKARTDASEMSFTWPALIAHASRDAELFPGDLLSSGTAGSLIESVDRAWLKPGDVVELEIERLGILRTPIVART